ncbi:MAG: response regulator [Promethearchaeota archaeon]
MVKVLIVEDDFTLQNLYKMILNSMGFELLGIAKNGQEAIDFFKNPRISPDIIIMDHRMPIKNGIEASKEILSLNNEVYIIFASADLSVKPEALAIGVKSFLEKPFGMRELKAEIDKILEI